VRPRLSNGVLPIELKPLISADGPGETRTSTTVTLIADTIAATAKPAMRRRQPVGRLRDRWLTVSSGVAFDIPLPSIAHLRRRLAPPVVPHRTLTNLCRVPPALGCHRPIVSSDQAVLVRLGRVRYVPIRGS
jgi:hypothetical protein